VFVPLVGVVLLELVRIFALEMYFEGEGLGHAINEQWSASLIAVTAVIAFALVMFGAIERVQQVMVRQNQELAAVNAVSTAVQGELDVDGIIDTVIESVIESTGAEDVAVTVFDPEKEGLPGHQAAIHRAAAGIGTPSAASSHLVDVPLSTSNRTVGRMRLRFPANAGNPDLLAMSTLQNIGHQLGASIETAQLVADLRRRQREGHSLYEVLVRISNQGALADILGRIARHARDRLDCDSCVIYLDASTAHLVLPERAGGDVDEIGTEATAGVCISSEDDRPRACPDLESAHTGRSSSEFPENVEVAISSREAHLGDLWVGRRQTVMPFTRRDRGYLATLSDLASIAISSARMREGEKLAAIRGERERIAREMHDSLAQVLGVTQLRLRALSSRGDIEESEAVTAELDELAEICTEAYRDVREAILGLRESTRTDRGLLESLAAFLEQYEQRCGILTMLETDLEEELVLLPQSEIQVIRVIQEALTNVRKHSGATRATVRITEAQGWVTFVVEDDGGGFDLARARARREAFGLESMRERLALIGGRLEVDAAPGRGTRVTARVPAAYHAVTS